MGVVRRLDCARQELVRRRILASGCHRSRFVSRSEDVAQSQCSTRRGALLRYPGAKCIISQVEILGKGFHQVSIMNHRLLDRTVDLRLLNVLSGKMDVTEADLITEIRWLMTAHANSGSALTFTPP